MPATSPTLRPKDPSASYKYYVEIQGILAAEFTEFGGFTIEREDKEVKEGGVNHFVHVLPGRVKRNTITLKRGISINSALWKWFATGLYDGKVKRVNVTITLCDALGKPSKIWNLLSAYPLKYVSPALSSGSSDVVIEEIELTHKGITVGP